MSRHLTTSPLASRLAAEFGRQSPLAQALITRLAESLDTQGDGSLARRSFDQWVTHLVDATGIELHRLPRVISLDDPTERAVPSPAMELFSAQTYYAITVKLLLWRAMREILPHRSLDTASPDSPVATSLLQRIETGTAFVDAGLPVPYQGDIFSWYLQDTPSRLRGELDMLQDAVAQIEMSEIHHEAEAGLDLLAALYQNLFPAKLRHALGEFYTPVWLVDHVLKQTGSAAEPGARVLDPACGSGTFLLRLIHHRREALLDAHALSGDLEAACRQILDNVVGFDLNPIAVVTAKAGYLLALGPLARYAAGQRVPIHHRDSILGEAGAEDQTPHTEEPFDLIVGNPPWIGWDHLPAAYRDATKPLWKQYGLFTLSGNDARHGGGKKDLSMLMLLRVADRNLRNGGRLAMVLTQTVFQTRGAGDGFRRFRLGADERAVPLCVLRVDDLAAIRPFADASNWTATLLLEKGRSTQYPVPYFRWVSPKRSEKTATGISDCGTSGYEKRSCWAEPIDPEKAGSPWMVRPEGLRVSLSALSSPSSYTAHLGANTGGANGVYWVHVLGREGERVRIRNLPGRGKHSLPTIETLVEPGLLHPLIRWQDVAPYRAEASAHLILAQDPVLRAGLDERIMRQDYPHTLDYLRHFESLLRTRAAYRRYQGGGPFFSMYNVGPYTVADHKVVWRRMDRRIRAVAVDTVDDPVLGRRPVVCQETCVLIATDTADEAYYLAAVLNSAVVNLMAISHNVLGGKGFGSPGMLEYLGIEKYQPWDSRHQKLTLASREAHSLAATKKDLAAIQDEIDLLVGRLRGLSHRDIAAIQREVGASTC